MDIFAILDTLSRRGKLLVGEQILARGLVEFDLEKDS